MSVSLETLERIKAQLKQARDQGSAVKLDLYTHLTEVFNRIMLHHPYDAYDKFEEISQQNILFTLRQINEQLHNNKSPLQTDHPQSIFDSSILIKPTLFDTYTQEEDTPHLKMQVHPKTSEKKARKHGQTTLSILQAHQTDHNPYSEQATDPMFKTVTERRIIYSRDVSRMIEHHARVSRQKLLSFNSHQGSSIGATLNGGQVRH